MRMLEQRPQTSVLLLESSAHRIGVAVAAGRGPGTRKTKKNRLQKE
ncbi:unnamed protein product [Amoebophrya sp. A25]|nr:unnamed protein product [Amoebophrya sp. A25]|eukprot:GSA25T00027917001.1